MTPHLPLFQERLALQMAAGRKRLPIAGPRQQARDSLVADCPLELHDPLAGDQLRVCLGVAGNQRSVVPA
jgi:hypothetical protein